MKADTHPNYTDLVATCSCGNVIKTRSTLGKELSIDVCSECHPFYTGKQKIVDSGGRIDGFTKRFGSRIGAKNEGLRQLHDQHHKKSAGGLRSRRFFYALAVAAARPEPLSSRRRSAP